MSELSLGMKRSFCNANDLFTPRAKNIYNKPTWRTLRGKCESGEEHLQLHFPAPLLQPAFSNMFTVTIKYGVPLNDP